MEHLGDITKISGYTAPIVDCIIGGSPCQDLSVAGKRAGLAGERSGLFTEQIRIVKEMRENERRNGVRADLIRPRYMVWENVPGAFSSNKGEDFGAVLEEIARVEDPECVIPMPPKGKWTKAGCIVGDRWSIAWRVHDAQFWGVPQRRRRIALVADFGGESAPEILFVRNGMQGNSNESGTQREDITEDAQGSIGTNDCERAISFQERAGKPGGGKGILIQDDHTGALSAQSNQYVVDKAIGCSWDGTQTTPTLTANNAGGSQRMSDKDNFNCVLQPINENEPIVYERAFGGKTSQDGTTPTITARSGTGGNNMPIVCIPSVFEWHNQDSRISGPIDIGCTISTNANGREGHLVVETYQDKVGALCSDDHKGANNQYVDQDKVIVSLDRASYNQGKNAKYDFEIREDGVEPTLIARGPGAVAYSLEPGIASREGGHIYEDVSGTIRANAGDNQMSVAYSIGNGQVHDTMTPSKELCKTLNFMVDPMKVMIAYGFDPGATRDVGAAFYKEQAKAVVTSASGGHNGVVEAVGVDFYNQALTGDKAKCLNNAATDSSRLPCVIENNVRYIVRRLTPSECERLQGYPDGWTDIGDYIDTNGKTRKTTDTARYKALGNSIALPFWKWLLERISAQYEREPTIASLFDGIGGFPYLWEQINGKGTCLWASEIEEFPIAVTKKRIG